LATKIKFHRTS